MPATQGVDTTIITPVTNDVATASLAPPMSSAPIAPATVVISPPAPTSMAITLPSATAAVASPQPVVVAAISPELLPPQSAPETPTITLFPDVAQMVAELKASGTLDMTAVTAPITTDTVALITPLAVHLANTAPVFHRPTATQLLQRAGHSSNSGHNYILWGVLAILALGALGWMVYSQMRMSGRSAQEVMSGSLKTVISPFHP